MPPTRRRLLKVLAWSAAAILLLAGIGILFVSYQTAQSLIHPERVVPPPTPANVNLTYENVSFTSADGTRLTGWWMPSDASPADNATLLFFHGFTVSKNQSLHTAPWFHAAGYNVLAFDFRAHGEAGGDVTTVGHRERDDARAAVAHVQNRSDMAGCAPSCPLVIVGWSMGAATALLVAPDVPNLKAVVVDSPFSTLREAASNSFTYFTGLPAWPFGPIAIWFAERETGVNLDEVAPVDTIGRIRVPLLLIHGTADPVAPPHEHEKLLAAAKAGGVAVEPWLVPGAAHVRSYGFVPEQYQQKVVGFLLANAPPQA